MDTHHERHLLDRFSVQTTVSSDYEYRTATEQDNRGEPANSLPLEMLRRGAAMHH